MLIMCDKVWLVDRFEVQCWDQILVIIVVYDDFIWDNDFGFNLLLWVMCWYEIFLFSFNDYFQGLFC